MDLERDATRLTYQELGGAGAPALLLHGLAGYSGEWQSSTRLLAHPNRIDDGDRR
jgi:pimeloyl-ACP methyl ester carboxylesterase